MRINQFGRIDVPVGEMVESDGCTYRCEVYKQSSDMDYLCERCSFQPSLDDSCLCNVLECCSEGRKDGECVVFVKQEGGKDGE